MKKIGNGHRRKKGRKPVFTLEQLWWKHNGRCRYCGCMTVLGSIDSNGATKDHVVPKVRGGKQAGNLVLSCVSCNSSKGSLLPDEWKQKERPRRAALSDL